MGNGCMSINAVKTVDAPTPKFKLIVVGDTGVGKTSVIQRYARNFFSSEYIPTELLNIESVVRKLSIPDQGIVTVELWDVPTCDELSTRKTYYMDTDAVIVVVDVCDEDIAEISNQWKLDTVTNIVTSKEGLSLENGIKNQPQVEKSNHPPKAGSIPVLLLGNKFDIAKSRFIHDHLSTNGVDATKVTFNNNQQVSTIQNQQITINVEMEVDVESHVNENGDSHDHMNGNGDSHDHMNENGDSQNHMNENGESHDDTKNHVNVEKQTDHEMSNDEIHDTKNHENNDVNNHEKPCDETTDEKAHDETHGEGVKMEKDFKTNENDKENHENEMGDKNKDPDGLMDSENSHKNLKNKESDEVKKEESKNEDIMCENNNMQSDHVPCHVNGDTGDMNHGDHEVQDGHVNEEKMDTTNMEANSPHDKLMDNTQKKLQKLFPKDLKDESSDLKSSENSNILNHHSTRSVESDIVADGSVVSATTCSTLPPCVDMLEQVAEDYGFVAGIPVSAKDPNGGIHEAIQSLVRHLMVKRRAAAPERKRKTDEISMKSHISVGRKRTRRNKRNLPEVEFDPLQDVGIIEIDEILRRCNPVLREAEVLVGGYREAIHDFKRACHKKNMTGSNRVSIEECISALKEAVSSPLDVAMEKTNVKTRLLLHEKTNGKSYSLVSDDVNGFVDLLVVDDNHEYLNTAPGEGESPIPTHVRLVLQVYKEKVHKSCSSVLESSTDLEHILTQLCHQVADKEEKAWDVAVAAGYSQSNVRRILSSLAQGKARMVGTMQQIKDAKKQVLNTQSRIKAALLF